MELDKILDSERMRTLKPSFGRAFARYFSGRQEILNQVDVEAIKKRAREIKERSVNNLQELKRNAVENLRKNGIRVFEAKDAAEARKLFLELVPPGEFIVKTKSNTISEIELVTELRGRNELLETDCGDFIVQICGEASIHPVTPALHVSIETIVKKIEEKFGVKLENSPEKIIEWVRKHVREKITQSKIGLTGANFISSDGCILILENEGNISLVSRVPEKHVIIAGIDKIVETSEDAVFLCRVAAIWGSGTKLPAYINIISSPSKTSDIEKRTVYGAQGAKEIDLILVDNGRSKMLESMKELLYCINCGSCLYFCPVYRQIFNQYGLHYLGGIGVVKTAFLNNLLEAVNRGLYWCTTCSACKVNCPVGLDVSEMVKNLRSEALNNNLQTEANKKMINNIRNYGNTIGKIEEGEIPKELYCC